MPEPTAGRPLRIYAEVPRYLPEHNAGAEHTLHAILRQLVVDGWEARVGSMDHHGPMYRWDGVEVHSTIYDEQSGRHWGWCDVGITHLHGTRRAVAWSRQGRPLVHLIHNHTQLQQQRVQPRDADLVVWNAKWIADLHAATWPAPTMLAHPVVDSADYRTENVDRFLCGTVTLINLAEDKGGKLFWRLAAARQDLPFLGVEGAYHLQVSAPQLPNVEQIDNQVDILPVYQRTRVLVMPSRYESWGRTAVEAMASGIPVIAAPTPGLEEVLTSPTLGPCGLFADIDDHDSWTAALKLLDSKDEWQRWSNLARQRAVELDAVTTGQLAELESKLARLARGESVAA